MIFDLFDTGAGSDLVISRMPEMQIDMGSGDDIFVYAGAGSRVRGGSGADNFWISNNVLIEDAKPEDRISFFGFDIHGGSRYKNSESPWANGPFGMRYGRNDAGELLIQDFLGRTMFVANFNFTPGDGILTAGIDVIEYDAYAIPLGQLRQSWDMVDTFRLLLGYSVKHLTGISIFEGVDPLVLDLDGDGIELLGHSSVSPRFDIDGDGFAERTGWTASNDGFLVRDLNGDGQINSVAEMFGDTTTSGFAALAAYDSNADGVIDASDSMFGSLRIWQDLDGDAVTDGGELKTPSGRRRLVDHVGAHGRQRNRTRRQSDRSDGIFQPDRRRHGADCRRKVSRRQFRFRLSGRHFDQRCGCSVAGDRRLGHTYQSTHRR